MGIAEAITPWSQPITQGNIMSNISNLATRRHATLSELESGDYVPEIRRLLAAIHAAVGHVGNREATDFRQVRQVVRAKEAAAIIGCGRSHFYALQNPKDSAWDPSFPSGFKLGDSPRSPTVWFADLIAEWLECRSSTARTPKRQPDARSSQNILPTGVRS